MAARFAYGSALALALLGFRLGSALYPLYRARPAFAVEPSSFLLPPDLGALLAATLGAFALALLLESALRGRFQATSFLPALDRTLATYAPLLLLLPCLLVVWPAAPLVSPLVLFFALDARNWLAFLAVGWTLVLKLGTGWIPRPRRTAPALGLLFVVLLGLTPGHRFRQPYDERYGTGDEPRYVRLAASLLHDGDADVSNAAENVGRRFSPVRTLGALASIPGAVVRTSGEAVRALFGGPIEGEASSLGGQVVAGRRGGEYYVYLPGFPLLIVPAMAVDSVVAPGRLPTVMVFCIGLAVLNALALFRLFEAVYPDREENLALAIALSLTLPLFAYSFQIYPEVAASICLCLCLVPILRRPSPSGRELFGFALGASLLPWLHTKYYSILGLVLVAFLVRHRRLSKSRLALALGLPALAVAFQALYLFAITGSPLPDALWVLNGYPRGTHLFNERTPSGLHYLFLGASEGLLVYAPHYLFALAGFFVLRRKSPWALWSSVLLLVPYVWIAASHDEGGAGGWSPPSRYFVAVTPVFALGMAAWVSLGRRAASVAFFSASLWIGLGMLRERNFLYDRLAFLGSGAIDPSPLLSSGGAYLAFLVLGGLALTLLDRKGGRPAMGAAAFVILVLLTGQAARLWSEPSDWMKTRDSGAARTLRPGRIELVLFRDCDVPALRFEGAGAPTELRIRGASFLRDVVVPPSNATELDVSADAFHQWTDEGRIAWRLLTVESLSAEERVRIEPVCRKEGVSR
jgi:hypothetical protein